MNLEWLSNLPDWAQSLWLVYVTFHDLIQWAILAIVGVTAWGQRKKKKELEELVGHIHDELHTHIEEDSSFHHDLGQPGMTKGT
jgi:hypothetical protein